jgi:UDP-N-acetylmuramate--alanine ligase
MTELAHSMTVKLKYKHIRFLGAAGIGMTALTQILEGSGVKISRSDLSYAVNDPLDLDIDLVVRSTAVPETDPDLIELRARGVEIWHRSDMLTYLSSDFKQLVVTGTHGKTTCTAMLAHVLVQAGLDPSYAVGGVLANYNNNGKAGQGEYFVLEGDESDKSYLKSKPYVALLTYVEPDHLENYPGGFEEIKKCFLGFLETASLRVVCLDDPLLAEYAAGHKGLVTYSSCVADADYYIDVESRVLIVQGCREYKLELGMHGGHNLVNACGVLAVACQLGISIEAVLEALASFKGIKRRFELINPSYGVHAVRVYDDYAHHPTELSALMHGALAMKPKRLVMVYQPHHPERTKQLWQDFVRVMREFPSEHLLLVADIYVARSKHIEGVTSERLVAEVARENVRYLAPAASSLDIQGNYKDMVAALKPGIDAVLQEGDLLLITGAGNISKIVPAFA